MEGVDTPRDAEGWDLGFKHVVLVSTIASPQGSLAQPSIHHWPHSGAPARNPSFVMPTNLSPDGDMRLVSGFQELGSFAIPAARSSMPERHAYMAALPRDDDGLAPGMMQRGVEADKALAKSVIAGLRAKEEERRQDGSLEGSEETVELRLYSIELGTRVEDALAVANADSLVWNWAKPDSPYLTQGSWYGTLDEAVVDGAWRAGRGFSISVEVVGEEGKMRMFEPGSGR